MIEINCYYCRSKIVDVVGIELKDQNAQSFVDLACRACHLKAIEPNVKSYSTTALLDAPEAISSGWEIDKKFDDVVKDVTFNF